MDNQVVWPDDRYYTMCSDYLKMVTRLETEVQRVEQDVEHFFASLDLFLDYCFLEIAMERGILGEEQKYIIQNFCEHHEEIKSRVDGYGVFLRRISAERYREKGSLMYQREELTYFITILQRLNRRYPLTSNGENTYLNHAKEEIRLILDNYIEYSGGMSRWYQEVFETLFEVEEIEEEIIPTHVPVANTKEEVDKKALVEEQKAKLEALIGLDTVKREIRSLVAGFEMKKLRQERGLAVRDRESYHLVFSGKPGTGKTTVARIVSSIYYGLGILPEDKVVEVDRSGMVAGYTGQTALKTATVIESALGGILFIDEAYALVKGKDDTFGSEAIDTLVKMMEDHRDNLVVIAAGYPEDMEAFINANEGLKSRFSRTIDFPDYTVDELMQIFMLGITKGQYLLADGVHEAIEAFFAKEARKVGFANARTVRKFMDALTGAQDERVINMLSSGTQIDNEQMQTFIMADVEYAIEASESTGSNERRIGFGV